MGGWGVFCVAHCARVLADQHTSRKSCMASSTTVGSTSARMSSIVASDLSVSGSRRISSCLRLQKMASEMFPCSVSGHTAETGSSDQAVHAFHDKRSSE